MSLSHDFKQFLDQSTDAHLISDLNGFIIYCNPACNDLFGYNEFDLEHKPITILMPEQYVSLHNKGMLHHNQTGEKRVIGSIVELEAKKKDDSVFPMELSLSKIKLDDRVVFSGIIRDISHRKNLEIDLKNKIEEREVLLKEVHHRVKNNLQIITSLIDLHAHKSNNFQANEILKDFSQRVYTIALLHEKIYETESLSQINIKHYLEELITKIKSSYNTADKNLDYNFKCPDIYLNIDRLVPLGMLLVEVLNNSLKHAFKSRNHGELGLVINESENVLKIRIYDNGDGFIDELTTKSLGSKLINSLLKQVGAQNLNMITDSGVTYCFEIKI